MPPEVTTWKRSVAVEPQADGKQRVRKVGMNLTATSSFAFSQLFREWNCSNIVQPYFDALHVSRVDALEIGGPPNTCRFLCEPTDRTRFASWVRRWASFCMGLEAQTRSDTVSNTYRVAVGTGATTRTCSLDVAR